MLAAPKNLQNLASAILFTSSGSFFMSNKALHLRNLTSSFRVSSKFIASSLFFLLLSSISTSVNAQQSPPASDVPSPTIAQSTSGGNQWLGQWKVTFDQSSGQPISFTFMLTPEGKLFVLVPESASGPPIAYEVPVKKISDISSLPANAQIAGIEKLFQSQTNTARQPDARTNIGAMTRAQQAYFLEYNKFARDIKDLGVGIDPETDDYRYRIVPQANQSQRVMMNAIAKRPGLKSYTSAVFVVKKKNESLTVTGICETNSPSSTPPAMPILPKSGSTDIQCSAGSRRVR